MKLFFIGQMKSCRVEGENLNKKLKLSIYPVLSSADKMK